MGLESPCLKGSGVLLLLVVQAGDRLLKGDTVSRKTPGNSPKHSFVSSVLTRTKEVARSSLCWLFAFC